jgi:phosphoribosyl-AMP cyclohydrolase / phosphoribosyl-ATP pyrophosphohydrolase
VNLSLGDRERLRFTDDGLLAAIVQDVAGGAVRMLGWMNREALDRTLSSGEVWFWSRSRQTLWKKGESSGNTLAVESIALDCDGDALLIRARPTGPTCHTGTRSCFEPNAARLELGWLADVLATRRDADPSESYTARLLASGIERVAQKVGEEAVETVIAGIASASAPTDSAKRERLISESADLLYHLLVLWQACGVDAGEVATELEGRHAKG